MIRTLRSVVALVVFASALLPVEQVGARGNTSTILFESWTASAGSAAGDIYEIESDGSGARQLTSNGFESERTPARSPDGQHIAYVGNGTREGVVVTDADGTNERVIYDGSGEEWSPTWSPDGKKLAFHEWDPDTWISRIYTINVDGSGLRAITKAHSYSPAWSPDGRWIVYVRFDGMAGGNRRLRLVRPDGSKDVPLTFGFAEAFGPAWSPDSRHIAFQGWSPDDDTVRSDDIFVMDIVTKKVTQVTSGQDYDEEPCWSPDGLEIAFSRSPFVADPYEENTEIGQWVQPASDIWAVHPDGSGLRQVTMTAHVAEAACSWGAN